MGGDDRDGTPTVDLSPNATRSPASSSAFDPPGDRFETVGELGRGGMGRVVDAMDRGLGRAVAIKQVLSSDPVAIARFEREARITARLEHPGIVPIHDAGRDRDGTPYYVMRRVDGRPLEDIVACGTFVQRLALVPNVLAACDATAYAHARGIVHRDIKPTNLLIGPFGETLLIDWGLARAIGETADDSIAPSEDGKQLTRAGAIAGTPGFMAPEQARGEDIDARTDVFALGSTLFYVLAGVPPYTASRATEMIERVGTDHPPDWSLLPAEVPADLRAIISKAMATDPANRYRDAGALAADLRQFVTGNLVAAHRYGLVEQLRRFARRHRAAIAVAAISLIVVIAGAVISVRRIVAERDDARDARELAEDNQRKASAVADLMLVERAREIVENSPEGALALLRQLPDDSAKWPQAATVAQIASLRGVAFGFDTGYPHGLRFEMSPDNVHCYVALLRGGVITIYDLETRSRRAIGEIPSVSGIRWLDRGHMIVVGLDGALETIDTATGARDREPAGHYGHVETDRAGRVWGLTPDHRVVELASLHATPVEIAKDVTDFTPDGTLTTAVFVHLDGSAVIRTPAGSWPISQNRGHISALAVGGARAAIFDGTDFVFAEIADGKLVEIRRSPNNGAQVVTIDGDRVLVMTPSSVLAYDRDGEHVLERGPCVNMTTTDAGVVIAHADGSFIVIDHGARFALGKHPLTIQRLVAGRDARFMVVVTTSGDLLAWDLTVVRPLHFALGGDEHVTGFDASTIWVRGPQLRRLDRTTGVSTTVLPDVAGQDLFSTISTSQGGTMFVADRWKKLDDHRMMRVPHLFDRDGNELATIPADARAMTWSDDGLVFADAAHDLWLWTFDRALAKRKLVGLPFEPSVIVSYGTWYAFASKSSEVARFDSHGNVDRLQAHDLSELAVDRDGTVFILGDNKLLRWPAHGPAVPVVLPATPDSISMSALGRVIHMRGAIAVIEPTSVRMIASTSNALQTFNDSPWAVTIETNRGLGVVDLRSGIEFPMLNVISGEETIFTQGNTIVAVDAASAAQTIQTMFQWRLTVPTDPAQLRGWLATATNAKIVSGSDAVVWP